MSIETHRVVIGACGWKHPDWLNDFYSEDLPEEWQLGFYSNEFPVVYVPASDWLDVADVSGWSEDTAETFRFILEISDRCLDDDACFSAALTHAASLGDKCLGLVFQLNPTLSADLPRFLSRLDAAEAIAPVCVDIPAMTLSDELQGILTNRAIAEVWHGQHPENKSEITPGLARGRLAISRVSSDALSNAQLRNVLDVCLAASSEQCISVLCFDGNPPSIEMLRNADIILNLL